MNPGIPTPVVVDVETTGFGRSDKIVEIAAITLDSATWETIDEYDTLINPERDVGPTGVHGITASMVEAAPTFSDAIAAIAARLQGAVLIAHNLAFDARMLLYEFERRGIAIDPGAGLCTYLATRKNSSSRAKSWMFPCPNSIGPWPMLVRLRSWHAVCVLPVGHVARRWSTSAMCPTS